MCRSNFQHQDTPKFAEDPSEAVVVSTSQVIIQL